MPRPRLPLRPGTIGPPLIVTEVFCWVICPALHLKEHATSFDQFKDDNAGKMMRAVFQFFLMVICETAAKEGFTFHIEGVKNDADEIIAYRFFGFLTGTDGETFAQVAASLLNRYEDDAKTEKGLRKRFDQNTLYAYEAYYAVCNPDARLWGVAAAVFTGIKPPDGLSTERLIKFFSLPDTQFLCTINTACAAQADCGMYFAEPPGCSGLSVTFPSHDMLYTVPPDFLKFATLYQVMLPEAQMQRARATMVSKVIIDALKYDSVPVEPDLKRQRILGDLGAEEFVYSRAAAAEDFAGVRGANPPPLTVFDQPRRDNDEILSRLADLEERQQGPPRLGMEPLLTNSTGFKFLSDRDAKNQRLMARIYLLHQKSAGAMLEGILSGGGLSPAYEALATAGKDLNDPEISKWFYENGDKNLSHNLNTASKLMVFLEQVCGVTDTHEIGQLVEKGTLDASRRGDDLHCNIFIATEKGATGKSSIVKWILRLRVPGTVKDIVFATAAALLTGGINGQSDQAGYITVFDEQPPESSAGDANGISKEQARKKHLLSNGGKVKVLYFSQDDKGGDRETKEAEANWCGMEITLANIRSLPHALESRYIMVRPSETSSAHGRRIENSMNAAAQTEEITGPMFDRVVKVFQQRQWFHFMVHRCVEIGYIQGPSMHGAALFLNKFLDELKNLGVLLKTPRVNSNIHAMAKIECISEAYQIFLVDHKGLITVESFRKIEPLLSVSVDNVISAIMEMAESICPNLPYGISCCIRDLYHRKAAAARAALDTKPFQNLFALDLGSNERDYSWFSVPKREVVEFAMVHVSAYTNGNQPSKGQIYDAIDGFCESAEAEYSPYSFCIPAEGKFSGQPVVVSCPGLVRTPCARLIDTHFRGVQQFEVHMGFIFSVDNKKTPKQTIVCAIEKALNFKHQLPHIFSTGKEQGSPKLVLETVIPDSEEELVVKTHVVANTYTQSFFSGYQQEVFGGGPSSDGRLKTDYDTWGTFRHTQQIHGDFSIPDEDIDISFGEDDDTYFFGIPVQKLTMDNVIISEEKKRLLKRILEEGGDFEPEDYVTGDDYHWNIIAENVPSQSLGFPKWLEGDQLMEQYRLIRTHPYVIRDRQKRQAVYRREDYKHYTMFHFERLVYEGLLDPEDAENKYKAIRHEPWVVEHRRTEPFNKEDYLIDPDCQDVYHWDVMKRDGVFEGLEGDALWQAYAKIRNEPATLAHFAKSREIEY